MAKNERQEASNNIQIHCLILIKLQGFVKFGPFWTLPVDVSVK